MSDQAYSTISNSLATLFENDITSQINRSTVMLQILDVVPGQAHNVNFVVRFGTAVGRTTTDGAVVDRTNDTQKDDKVPAQLNYGIYTEVFGVTGLALAGALATGNPLALKDLFAEELGDAVERFAKKVEIDIFTGNGSNAIVGMNATAGALRATGVYANIDRAVRTQWAATEMLNGGVGRALTLDLMREMRRRIYVASGTKPDVIVTTPELHQKYGALMGQQRRWVQDVTLRGQRVTLDGGYQVLEFDGIPVIESVDCPAGVMDFINTRRLQVVPLPDNISSVNQGMGQVGVKGTEETQFGMPTPKLTARINPLGRDGDRVQFQLIAYIAMRNKQCNSGGLIGDLNAAL